MTTMSETTQAIRKDPRYKVVVETLACWAGIWDVLSADCELAACIEACSWDRLKANLGTAPMPPVGFDHFTEDEQRVLFFKALVQHLDSMQQFFGALSQHLENRVEQEHKRPDGILSLFSYDWASNDPEEEAHDRASRIRP